MTSKTIILSSQDEKNPAGRGILTLGLVDGILECRLRLYSYSGLDKNCKIGVYHLGKVSSANLLFKTGVYLSSLVGDFDLNKDFYIAIVDTLRDNKLLLTGGTYGGYFSYDKDVFSNIKTDEIETKSTDAFSKEQNLENEEINKQNYECENVDEDRCLHCKYKEYFYKENVDTIDCSKIEIKENNFVVQKSEKDSETKEIPSILEQIIPQFDNVFNTYPVDEQLCQLLPNSKFVKIVDGEDCFSLGALYDNEEIKVICYAKFCEYNMEPPKELGEHFQWLPIDKDDPLSNGYYIVFQDATDLKIVQL